MRRLFEDDPAVNLSESVAFGAQNSLLPEVIVYKSRCFLAAEYL
jgi:hypothetical protein